jgi:hypothetical protein
MKDRPTGIDKGSLERLIDAEVDAALAKFRTSDFEPRLRQKARAESEGRSVSARLRTLPVWAWPAAAAVVFSCGLILLSSLTSSRRPPLPDLAVTVENILRRAPGYHALERGEAGLPRAVEESPSPMNVQVRTALLKARRSAASMPLTDEARASSGKSSKRRPMTLEEIYRVLFLDRSIERVLALTS